MKPRRFEDLPPKIQELLHKKGWTYPPDDELKRQRWEASKRFDGNVHTDPEILREIYLEKGWTWIDGTECKSVRKPHQRQRLMDAESEDKQ